MYWYWNLEEIPDYSKNFIENVLQTVQTKTHLSCPSIIHVIPSGWTKNTQNVKLAKHIRGRGRPFFLAFSRAPQPGA